MYRYEAHRWLKMRREHIIFVLLLLLVVICVILIPHFRGHISTAVKHVILHGSEEIKSMNTMEEDSITPIENSKHFMVSAFIDHRFNKAIRVISIIRRESLKSLHCIYCNKNHSCQTVEAEVEIHSDHFGFPFGASDVLCRGDQTKNAEYVAILTEPIIIHVGQSDFLKIHNREEKQTFKFNFTVCISSLFGAYNNVLQFAQTMEMYKLLGIQHVVIYNTSCGTDLEKLLQHYKREGILEVISWPIDQFLKPSAGWNYENHKGELHYYGQLVTLNECIYRHMYQSRYVLLNDIDEIIMPYKHANLPLLIESLEQEHTKAGVFLIENHIFPYTQSEMSGKFSRAEWKNIPGINIMQHIYREPDRKQIFNPTKMIVNPRSVVQTSVHSTLKNIGNIHRVPFDLCHIVHVRVPLQSSLTKEQLIVDKRVWDFEQELVPNVDRALQSSGF